MKSKLYAVALASVLASTSTVLWAEPTPDGDDVMQQNVWQADDAQSATPQPSMQQQGYDQEDAVEQDNVQEASADQNNIQQASAEQGNMQLASAEQSSIQQAGAERNSMQEASAAQRSMDQVNAEQASIEQAFAEPGAKSQHAATQNAPQPANNNLNTALQKTIPVDNMQHRDAQSDNEDMGNFQQDMQQGMNDDPQQLAAASQGEPDTFVDDGGNLSLAPPPKSSGGPSAVVSRPGGYSSVQRPRPGTGTTGSDSVKPPGNNGGR